MERSFRWKLPSRVCNQVSYLCLGYTRTNSERTNSELRRSNLCSKEAFLKLYWFLPHWLYPNISLLTYDYRTIWCSLKRKCRLLSATKPMLRVAPATLKRRKFCLGYLPCCFSDRDEVGTKSKCEYPNNTGNAQKANEPSRPQ